MSLNVKIIMRKVFYRFWKKNKEGIYFSLCIFVDSLKIIHYRLIFLGMEIRNIWKVAENDSC